LTTIRARSGWRALDLAQVWQYRDLLLTLAGRDIKLRYRQTALGAIWVVLQPLVGAGIFSFVFGKIAKVQTGDVPLFLISYVGFLAYNVFAGTLTKVSSCLVSNSQLISKVFFPRLVLPLSNAFSTLIDFSVALVMAIILTLSLGFTPGWHILLLPVWLALVLMLSMGVGLYAAALMVSYRDVQYILPVAAQFLLYASPVAYPLSLVPAKYHTLYMYNPMAGLIEAFRWSLIGRGELPMGPLVYSAACAVVAFVVGAFAFKNMEKKFADVI